VRITLFGTRGSLPSPGPDTVRYGGNTSCVLVEGEGVTLVLDAGTGIRRLGDLLAARPDRIDVLLSHLHVDHIQGLGFFAPLFQSGREVHIWGPISTTQNLRGRLARYLSPPLFPVPIRELPSDVSFHDLPLAPFAIGALTVRSQLICHPGPTVGYRITEGSVSVSYMSDHEPALGARDFPGPTDWLSGYPLAASTDLLLHDAQYLDPEYETRVGWGHSTVAQAVAFAAGAGVARLVTFHHDPSHGDADLERAVTDVAGALRPAFPVEIGAEGATYDL
jgi:phosphoribosyl 1,2-cyclic phosphodiesterase